MASPKRTPAEIVQDVKEIQLLYAQGMGQQEIADQINSNRSYNLTQQMISYDLSRDREIKAADLIGFVYLIRESFKGLVKIGRTRDLARRMEGIVTSCPQDITLIGAIYVNDCYKLELDLHKEYESKRYKKEWFSLTDEDVHTILDKYPNETIAQKDDDMREHEPPSMQLTFFFTQD